MSKQTADFIKGDLAPLQKWKSIKALVLDKQIAYFADLIEMVTNGWQWFVLPYFVEEKHPGLIDLIHSALNMSNSIFGIQFEIELASSIAAAVKAKRGHVEDWNQLALECCQGPSLKKGDQYKAIAKFVRLCSGALAAIHFIFF